MPNEITAHSCTMNHENQVEGRTRIELVLQVLLQVKGLETS